MGWLTFSGDEGLQESPTGVVGEWLRRELSAKETTEQKPLRRRSPAELRCKRWIDVAGSLAIGAPALPILALAMLAVLITSPGPILLCQPRVGLAGRRFGMWKLRTMHLGADEEEALLARLSRRQTFFKIADDPRVLPVGCWLRRTSIDELPQLWNVLRGDMSLVGPRPLLLSDFARFPRNRQLRRFTMLPGLTGLWQVSGRSERSDRERMDLDLRYVEEWRLGLDLKILWRTLTAVLSGRGAT